MCFFFLGVCNGETWGRWITTQPEPWPGVHARADGMMQCPAPCKGLDPMAKKGVWLEAQGVRRYTDDQQTNAIYS